MVATPPDTSNAEGEQLSAPRTIAEALAIVHPALQGADLYYGHGTDNAWDEAVYLVLCACSYPPDADTAILDEPLPSGAWKKIQQWLSKRVGDRSPLPYIIGEAWFADLPFRCDSRALVPRSPLAEVIRGDYSPWWYGPAPERLLDLCSGGGCIGIAAAVYASDLSVVLADIDSAALQLAEENIRLHQVGGRVATMQSDLFSSFGNERFDIILCNPPYVGIAEFAGMPAEYHAEPEHALTTDRNGLALALRILEQAAEHRSPGGVLFMELGNSWVALDAMLSDYPLTWLQFADGGQGVLVVREDELAALVQRLLTRAQG